MESLYNLMEYHILHGQDYLDEDMKFHRTIARAAAIWWLPSWLPSSRVGGGVHRGHPPRSAARRPWTPTRLYWSHQVRRQHLARDAMTLHLSYNRDLYRKMHRARSGEPPLAPKCRNGCCSSRSWPSPKNRKKKSKSNANSPHDGARCSCHAGCFSVLTQAAGCITTRQRCRPCDARRGSSTRAGSCSPPAPVPC